MRRQWSAGSYATSSVLACPSKRAPDRPIKHVRRVSECRKLPELARHAERESLVIARHRNHLEQASNHDARLHFSACEAIPTMVAPHSRCRLAALINVLESRPETSAWVELKSRFQKMGALGGFQLQRGPVALRTTEIIPETIDIPCAIVLRSHRDHIVHVALHTETRFRIIVECLHELAICCRRHPGERAAPLTAQVRDLKTLLIESRIEVSSKGDLNFRMTMSLQP